ncbi:MAG: helicase-exonuclease AddAB subunit AddA [Pelotomaculum sp.]|nr:helicase-exonuclease AddAB subunit AddA [Pelotomaculum sp.]
MEQTGPDVPERVGAMSGGWTAEQLEAISARGGDVLVAASAGTGKTAVLAERIIRHITDPIKPVDVDRLLVVTFTSAAAAEMRERIRLALAREISRRPESGHLQRQAALLGRACISTVHSFCLDLLRQHFYRIGLDPSFRVADETEAALIQTGALEEVFERRYAAEDNIFAALVDCYGGRHDDALLQELVLDAYKFARSTPWPEDWLDGLAEGFNLPGGASFDRTPWSAVLKQAAEIELAGARADLEAALRIAREPGGPQAYLANLEQEHDLVCRLLQACRTNAPWAELYSYFKEVVFSPLKQCRKEDADLKLAGQARNFRESAKKKVMQVKSRYFSLPPEDLCADLRRMTPLIKELAGLVREFDATYRKAKATRGVVDFNDLEHYCLQVLAEKGPSGAVPSQVALELQEKFVEVLVDEYQDINAVQETILQMVSRKGEGQSNLFMVGDVKQSIYRFRLAEPGLFLKKYASFSVGTGGGQGRRLALTANFRSRQGVVSAVNFIFKQIMTPAVGEMAYGSDAMLVYGADYPPVPEGQGNYEEAVELHLVERGPAGKDGGGDDPAGEEADGGVEAVEEIEEELEAGQKEARLVARRIKELLGGSPGGEPALEIYDRELKKYRPLTYRDVAVLLRATAGYANSFVEEFRREGIPAYAELSTGYFESTEVETVISLLKIIDNPRQDIPLAGVLRSPAVGLKAGDLARIRLASPRGDFYDAVVAASLAGQGELSERLADFLKKLEEWRTIARQGTLADLIWAVYRDTGYYDFTGCLPGGGQRQANLRALHDRARQFETTAFRGLFLFLRFIERLREGGRDFGAARLLSEKENVVRIMSIHKSKGLEFPVVFVAGLGRNFNFRNLNKAVLFHKDLGLGPQLVDAEARVTRPTAAKLALKHRLKMEALAEEMRILYVAMTRAQEKLILVGSARNLPGCARRWCGPAGTAGWALPDGFLAGAGTCLDWLMAALARHRDGAAIRELAACAEEPPAEVAADRSRWRVFFSDSGGRSAERAEEPVLLAKVRRMEPLEPAGPLAGMIKARLEWSYPAIAVLGRPAKAAVTELKRRFDQLAAGEEQYGEGHFESFRLTAGRPLFMQEKRGLTAAEAGEALHLVMQHLDLTGSLDITAVRSQIEDMVWRELLTPEQAAAVPAEKIAAFFAGPLGRRLLAGFQVLRELPFTMAVQAAEIYPELVPYPGEAVLVQGVIDCLVDEGDGYLLLDYKTGKRPLGRPEEAARRYCGQLNIYARAVESILGRKVKEKYLYLFEPGLEIRCD